MLRKILLPTIFLVLGYGFWVSPDFKVIAAGDKLGAVAILDNFILRSHLGMVRRSIKRNEQSIMMLEY